MMLHRFYSVVLYTEGLELNIWCLSKLKQIVLTLNTDQLGFIGNSLKVLKNLIALYYYF